MVSAKVRERFKEPYVREDRWVRDLFKEQEPEKVAKIIERRINNPRVVGPYLWPEETAIDIIAVYIDEHPDARKKVEPAVAFMLYQMMQEKAKETAILLDGVFALIEAAKLRECHHLLFEWLKRNDSFLEVNSITDEWLKTYRNGMMAFAVVQPKNNEVEEYWKKIWDEKKRFWWLTAFYGLSKQSPIGAAVQLHKLVERKVEGYEYALLGMWANEHSRGYLHAAIANGLNREREYAGVCLNALIGKLSGDDCNILMTDLQERVKRHDFKELDTSKENNNGPN